MPPGAVAISRWAGVRPGEPRVTAIKQCSAGLPTLLVGPLNTLLANEDIQNVLSASLSYELARKPKMVTSHGTEAYSREDKHGEYHR